MEYPRVSALSIAANFLGLDAEELSQTQINEAIGELTNMIAGSLVSNFESPLPVIVISSLGQASCQPTLGAVEVLAKPGGPYSVVNCKSIWLTRFVRPPVPESAVQRQLRVQHVLKTKTISAKPFGSDVVIAIGASTGGTEAIRRGFDAYARGYSRYRHYAIHSSCFLSAFANHLN